MQKLFLIAATGVLMAACSKDDGSATIQLPENYSDNTLVVSYVNLDNMFSAKEQDDVVVYYDTLEVKNGKATMKLDPKGPARYNVETPMMVHMQPEFYASPGDKLNVTIKSFEPLDYSVTGTELMEDITALAATTHPIRMEYVNLINSADSISPEVAREILNRYDESVKKFVADHPKSQAVPYAIVELSGDDFKVLYDNMTPEAKKSILMPYAELYNQGVEEMQSERNAEEERKAEVASGTIPAPAFTLPDLQGKMVSLSDFRGKWVVLDFWGSWCGWCIKGFPALKEAYKQYGDKIVVIGIDCNESEAEWKEGVKQHQIPWLNLYNGHDQALYQAYGIEGFPTKAIINPEGKLVDLTTGEDPSFYERLASFVK